MYALVRLTVSGTDTAHLSVIDENGKGDFAGKMAGNRAQKGDIPNEQFRNALRASSTNHIDVQMLMGENDQPWPELVQAQAVGYTLINTQYSCPKERDLRNLCNAGDWLHKPGYLGFEDGSKIHTPSMILTIDSMNLWTDSVTVNPLERQRWPEDATVVEVDTTKPIPLRDEREDDFACIMIKHDEDPGFVAFVTSRLKAFQENPEKFYSVLRQKLPRFNRMYDRYQGMGLYYQIIVQGSEGKCRSKTKEMLDKYYHDSRCLNFDHGDW